MKVIYEILTAATVLLGFIAIGVGIWLWLDKGFPMNDILPNRNNLGNNPIHITYSGILISLVSILHGDIKYDWFSSNKST